MLDRLFLDAIKDNPYIKSPQAQLAYLYLDIEEFDSAYYFAKDAFKIISYKVFTIINCNNWLNFAFKSFMECYIFAENRMERI